MYFRRKRRTTDVQSCNDSDFVCPTTIPVPDPEPAPSSPLQPNLKWPTANNITKEDAQRACSSPIFKSPAYGLCANFTQHTFDAIVASCVDDVQVYWSSVTRINELMFEKRTWRADWFSWVVVRKVSLGWWSTIRQQILAWNLASLHILYEIRMYVQSGLENKSGKGYLGIAAHLKHQAANIGLKRIFNGQSRFGNDTISINWPPIMETVLYLVNTSFGICGMRCVTAKITLKLNIYIYCFVSTSSAPWNVL